MATAVERVQKKCPVSLMFFALVQRALSDELIDEIFRDHRESQVESDVLLSVLVGLLMPVVYGEKASLHASYQEEKEDLSFSKQAMYKKAQGVEPQVSSALVDVTSCELGKVVRSARATFAGPIPDYHTFVIDGKRLDGTEHRVEETRQLKSSPLPGTVLAVLDTQTRLFVSTACSEDAYANERKILLDSLPPLRAGALYMADRNFCDGPLIQHFIDSRAYFVVRQHGRSPSRREIPDESRELVGKDSRGRKVYEQRIEVHLPHDGWTSVRQITVELDTPLRNGETELVILTNLPETTDGPVIADAYDDRWTIEKSLGYIAQALNAEIKTLAYPGAALLSFCIGILLYNTLSSIKSIAEKYADLPEDVRISYYYMAQEIARTQTAIELAIPESYWQKLASMTRQEFLAWMKEVIRATNFAKYKSHPRAKKKPPPKKQSGKTRPHVSTQRLIEQRK